MKNDISKLTSARYELLTSKKNCFSLPAFEVVIQALDDAIGYSAPEALYSDLGGIPKNPRPIASLPAVKSSRKGFKIALCAGHSRPGDSGAASVTGVSEHHFYSQYIIDGVAADLRSLGYEVYIFDRYEGNSYGRAMKWLAKKLKSLEIDLAYEFHFNSASPKASGFETLFWHKSKVSDKVAEAMQVTQAAHYPEMYDRGVEPLGDQAHERGTLFCSLPHCSSVILEPFFGSNKLEVATYMSRNGRAKIISMLTEGIDAGALTLIA